MLFEQRGLKSSKFYKECTSSLALLPPRNIEAFEEPITKFHKLFKCLKSTCVQRGNGNSNFIEHSQKCFSVNSTYKTMY